MLTMYKIAIVLACLACLACTAHGQQLQPSMEQQVFEPADIKNSSRPFVEGSGLKTLASFLLALDGSKVAFNSVTAGVQSPARNSTQSVLRHNAPAMAFEAESDKKPPTRITRRDAVALTGLAGLAAALPPSAAEAKSKSALSYLAKLDLNESIVLILRVQEATGQETRMVRSGKYKELQRANIKKAMKFMIRNYALEDRFASASRYAEDGKQMVALGYGQRATDNLQTVIDYFPDDLDLSVNDLTAQQKTFVLNAMDSVSSSINAFCELMPEERVEWAKKLIIEENRLNREEYPKDEELLNMPKGTF